MDFEASKHLPDESDESTSRPEKETSGKETDDDESQVSALKPPPYRYYSFRPEYYIEKHEFFRGTKCYVVLLKDSCETPIIWPCVIGNQRNVSDAFWKIKIAVFSTDGAKWMWVSNFMVFQYLEDAILIAKQCKKVDLEKLVEHRNRHLSGSHVVDNPVLITYFTSIQDGSFPYIRRVSITSFTDPILCNFEGIEDELMTNDSVALVEPMLKFGPNPGSNVYWQKSGRNGPPCFQLDEDFEVSVFSKHQTSGMHLMDPYIQGPFVTMTTVTSKTAHESESEIVDNDTNPSLELKKMLCHVSIQEIYLYRQHSERTRQPRVQRDKDSEVSVTSKHQITDMDLKEADMKEPSPEIPTSKEASESESEIVDNHDNDNDENPSPEPTTPNCNDSKLIQLQILSMKAMSHAVDDVTMFIASKNDQTFNLVYSSLHSEVYNALHWLYYTDHKYLIPAHMTLFMRTLRGPTEEFTCSLCQPVIKCGDSSSLRQHFHSHHSIVQENRLKGIPWRVQDGFADFVRNMGKGNDRSYIIQPGVQLFQTSKPAVRGDNKRGASPAGLDSQE